jgi:hypothetical protein
MGQERTMVHELKLALGGSEAEFQRKTPPERGLSLE